MARRSWVACGTSQILIQSISCLPAFTCTLTMQAGSVGHTILGIQLVATTLHYLSQPTMSRPLTSRLTLPGAGTAILRNINSIWKLYDASYAIPYDLHPHGEHRANKWSRVFQMRLERLVLLTNSQMKDYIQEQMRDVVYSRHQGRQSRLLCVTVCDLDRLYRRIRREQLRVDNAAERAERLFYRQHMEQVRRLELVVQDLRRMDMARQERFQLPARTFIDDIP